MTGSLLHTSPPPSSLRSALFPPHFIYRRNPRFPSSASPRFQDMEESSTENESLIARIQQLEHERDELRKDIEQLCIQQAGPSYLLYATRMHFQRTAGLEQEIEHLKNKLAAYTRHNLNLKEELSEAYRSHLAELHSSEVSKNLEADRQLKFFQGCVASAFAERDNALMEAEKAKEQAEIASQKLNDAQQRLEELTSNAVRNQDLLTRLHTELQKQGRETEMFKKVITKFYEIKQQSLVGVEDEDISWDTKCVCLLDDPAETWSFDGDREASTNQYINALQEELDSLRSSFDNLQNKLRMGLEIENHLKRQIRKLENYKSKADKLITNGIARLREYHSQQRLVVVDLLDEGRCHLNSFTQVIKERLGPINVCAKSSDDDKCYVDNSRLTISTENGETLLKVAKEVDTSEAFSQALQEKVSALLLLQQEEERHFMERNVNAALQKKLDELQRGLLQVTNEKVKALIELANLKKDYELLKEKINRGSIQEKLQPVEVRRECVTSGKEGRLKNLLNNNYLKRWVGGVEHDSSRGGSSSSSEGYFTGKRHGYSIDEARLKIENATLRDTVGSIEHLTSVVRKLRLSLMKANNSFTSDPIAISHRTLDEIISEARLVKTALGTSLPLSWSGDDGGCREPSEGLMDDYEDSTTEKMDAISAAGFEMAELLILASQVMKGKSG
ncbi:hypothetical protein AKJ16_DCAP10621 [Drosera capensis]